MDKCCFKNDDIFIACNKGVEIFSLTNIAAPLANTPISLGSINIDTSKLCNSGILLTFSGEINPTLGFSLNPAFRVIRECNGVRVQVSDLFQISSLLTFANIESFSYQVCDCINDCDCSCVSYTIELLPGTIAAGVFLSINNVFISAKAVDSCC